MALLDIFKKKKPKEKIIKLIKKPKKEVSLEKAVEEKAVEVKPQQIPKKEEVAISKKKRKEVITEAYRILKTPHVTEKATSLAKGNQYVFKVWKRADKIEIKKAIQDLYGVDVLDIRIIKIPKRPRKLGRQKGWKKGYKKAIVKIKEGQKIEVLPR